MYKVDSRKHSFCLLASERVRAAARIESFKLSVLAWRILRRYPGDFLLSLSLFAASPQNKHNSLKQKSDALTRDLVRGGIAADVLVSCSSRCLFLADPIECFRV
ncbi:unnamed protein product [Chrysodeixis includens]|uniref:Uncharacterized protein n=1 Tax=Chrysodeixis includens TaxID=689277 RepID=A0A9N8KSM6_CHRIL|nr:unnamed protein product [Chrysodeixis includens]